MGHNSRHGVLGGANLVGDRGSDLVAFIAELPSRLDLKQVLCFGVQRGLLLCSKRAADHLLPIIKDKTEHGFHFRCALLGVVCGDAGCLACTGHCGMTKPKPRASLKSSHPTSNRRDNGLMSIVSFEVGWCMTH